MIIKVLERPEFKLQSVFISFRRAILIVLEPAEYKGKIIVLPEIDPFLLSKRLYFKEGSTTDYFNKVLNKFLDKDLNRLETFSKEEELKALSKKGTKFLLESHGLSRAESHGFFISPNGSIYFNQGVKHIDCILKHPQRFGFTKEYLRKKFTKHQEPVGFEGKARGKIISKLVKNDWIHLRYIPRIGEWIFNVKSIRSSIDRLCDFTKDCYINGLIKPDDTINIKEREVIGSFFKSTRNSGGFLFLNYLKTFYLSDQDFCCACCIHEMNNHLLTTAGIITEENVGVCILRKVIIPDAAHTKCRNFISSNFEYETEEEFEKGNNKLKEFIVKYHIIRGSLWTHKQIFNQTESFNEAFNNLRWNYYEAKRWNSFVKNILVGVKKYGLKIAPINQCDYYPSVYTDDNYKDLFMKYLELCRDENFPYSFQPFIAWDEAFNKKLGNDPENYIVGDGKTFLPKKKFEPIVRKHFLKNDDKLKFIVMDNKNIFIVFTDLKVFIVNETKTYEGAYIRNKLDDYPKIKFLDKKVNDEEVTKLFKMYYEMDLQSEIDKYKR